MIVFHAIAAPNEEHDHADLVAYLWRSFAVIF